jgi:short-subunit dehydrogenase
MNLEEVYPKRQVVIICAGNGLGKALAIIFARRKYISNGQNSISLKYILTILSYVYAKGIFTIYLDINPEEVVEKSNK